MAKLSLYKVGTSGRVNLGALGELEEFYTAEKAEDGTITLSPVEVNTTSTKKVHDPYNTLPQGAQVEGTDEDDDTPPFN